MTSKSGILIVAMSEENNFKKAVALLQTGRKKEAAKAFLVLYEKATDRNDKLQVIDALINALDPVEENQKLIKAAADGIITARQINRGDMEAYFMARKADFLTNEVSLLKYRQHNLKLSPDWISFATEADKNEHEALTREIEKLISETIFLLKEAVGIAQKVGSKKTEGCVWMSFGQVISTRYIHFKMDAMSGSSEKAKWWIKLEPLRRYGLENYLFFNLHQIKQLRLYISDFIGAYLKAAKIFQEIDDSMEAYALYNLANNLNTAFEFNEAEKYLTQAEIVARKYNMQFLLKQIEEMGRIIRDKNKNIPNYLGGEKRDFPKKI